MYRWCLISCDRIPRGEERGWRTNEADSRSLILSPLIGASRSDSSYATMINRPQISRDAHALAQWPWMFFLLADTIDFTGLAGGRCAGQSK